MKTEESFYIKILLWAFNKKDGFTEQELLDEFNIENESVEYFKYIRLFKDGNPMSGKPSIVTNFANIGNITYWCLTDTGESSAVDYLDLKETRENSSEAKKLAITSIWISIAVGVISIVVSGIQILMTQDVEVTNLPDIQKVNVENKTLKTEIIDSKKYPSTKF